MWGLVVLPLCHAPFKTALFIFGRNFLFNGNAAYLVRRNEFKLKKSHCSGLRTILFWKAPWSSRIICGQLTSSFHNVHFWGLHFFLQLKLLQSYSLHIIYSTFRNTATSSKGGTGTKFSTECTQNLKYANIKRTFQNHNNGSSKARRAVALG